MAGQVQLRFYQKITKISSLTPCRHPEGHGFLHRIVLSIFDIRWISANCEFGLGFRSSEHFEFSKFRVRQ